MASETAPSQTVGDVTSQAEIEQQRRAPTPPTSAAGPSTSEVEARNPSPKEASTPSGDVPADQTKEASEVNRDDPNVNVVEVPPRSPTFKEQVYGYARLIRGTVLGQPGVKEQGQQVLRGEQNIPLRRGSQSSK